VRRSLAAVLVVAAGACGQHATPAPAAEAGPPAPAEQAAPADAPPAATDAAPADAAMTPAQRAAYKDQLDALRPAAASAGPWRPPTRLVRAASAAAFCAGYLKARKPTAPARGCEPTGDVHGDLPAPYRRAQVIRYGELGGVHDPDALRRAALVIETARGAFVREDVAHDPNQWVDLSLLSAEVVHGRLVLRYARARGRRQVEEVEAVIVCGVDGKAQVACTGEIPTSYTRSWDLAPAYDADGNPVPVPPAPAPVVRKATVELDDAGAVVVTPADDESKAWYGEVAGRHELTF